MSDDLERLSLRARAAKALHDAWDASEECPGEMYSREARMLAKAALLSFLDMDEAGVERLAGAFYASGPLPLFDWAELPESSKRGWIEGARAVLSELRKMAGEKDV